MAKLSILAGATSQSINIFIQDSSSTTGAGLTGLVFNTSSLVAYYALPKAAAVQITLATLAAITTAYSSGGFKEVDATNMPGWYRLDLPDAAIASGRFVSVHLKGATNMAPCPLEIELTAWNNQDGVRGGMTALPNAAAEAAGGLYTRGTGAGQINQDANGRIDANVKTWIGGAIPAVNVTGVPLVDAKYLLGTIFATPATAGIIDVNLKNVANAAVSTSTAQIGVNAVNIGGTAQTGRDIGASVLLSAGTGTGQLDFTSGVVKANLAQILGTALTETAGQIAAAFKQFFNIASPTSTMNVITTVTTTTTATNLTTNNDKTGYGLSAAAVQAVWDALTSALTTAGSIGKRLADFITGDAYVRLGAPVGASISADIAEVEAETDDIAAVKAKTDNLPAAPAAVSDIPTANANADALLDRANGVETSWTFRQAMRILLSALGGKADGAATTTAHFRDMADSKNRITATVDASGNRTAVTLDNT